MSSNLSSNYIESSFSFPSQEFSSVNTFSNLGSKSEYASIKTNSDGTIVAVSSVFEQKSSDSQINASHDWGIIKVFQFDTSNNSWSQLGSDISGNTLVSYYGQFLELSCDGLTLAFTSGLRESDQHDSETQKVHVYKYNSSLSDWESKFSKDMNTTNLEFSNIKFHINGDLINFSFVPYDDNKKLTTIGIDISNNTELSPTYFELSNISSNLSGNLNDYFIEDFDHNSARYMAVVINNSSNNTLNHLFTIEYISSAWSLFHDNIINETDTNGIGRVLWNNYTIGYIIPEGGSNNNGIIKTFDTFSDSLLAIGSGITNPDVNSTKFDREFFLVRDGSTIFAKHFDSNDDFIYINVYTIVDDDWVLKKTLFDDEFQSSGDNSLLYLAVSELGYRYTGSISYSTSLETTAFIPYIVTSWFQKGNDIEGTLSYARLGSCTELSYDGNTIIIGSPDHGYGISSGGYGTSYAPGLVQIYSYDSLNNLWVQKGQDLAENKYGTTYNFNGSLVTINGDGNIVAFTYEHNTKLGIFKYNSSNSQWENKGSNTLSIDADTCKIRKIKLSSDGDNIAFLVASNSDGDGSFTYIEVYRFQESTDTWVLKYPKYNFNEDPFDLNDFHYFTYKYGFDFSGDGTHIAYGYNTSNNVGAVRLLNYSGSSWNIIGGSEITGQNTDEYFGAFVSLNNDGSILAIGNKDESTRTSCNISTHYKKTDPNNTFTLPLLGNIITIDKNSTNDEAFFNVFLSDSGNELLITNKNSNDGNSTNFNGACYLYEYKCNNWLLVNTQENQQVRERFGAGLALSGNGLVFASGSDLYDVSADVENLQDAGQVRVFHNELGEYQELSLQSSLSEQDLSNNETPGESNICFTFDTIIKTDQGYFKVCDIDKDYHTINKQKIIAVTNNVLKKVKNSKYKFTTENLIKIGRDAFSKNVPHKDLYLTWNHKIFINGKFSYPLELLLLDKKKKIRFVKYNGEKLYNILLKDYQLINANNLLIETLHPGNKIALLYKAYLNTNCNKEKYKLKKYYKENKLNSFLIKTVLV